MKKTKLLMPLVGVAALGATVAPILTLTSCGQKPDASIKKIEATSNFTNTLVGATITRDDVEVMVYNMDGTIAQTTDFTSDIPEAGYKFTKEEDKVFTIQYKGHSTTIKFTAYTPAKITVDVAEMKLDLTTNGFATCKTFGVYAYSVESFILEMPHELFEVKSSDDKVAVYNATTQCIEPKSAGNATITVSLKDVEGVTSTFNVTVESTNTQISAVTEKSGNACVTLSGKANTEGLVTVPNFVKVNDKTLPVTEITTVADSNVSAIKTIILPTSITKLGASIFDRTDVSKEGLVNILYLGSEKDWNSISKGQKWQGKFAVGVYCLGDEEGTKYINFTNCAGSKFLPAAESEIEKNTLAINKNIGGIAGDTYTIQFDYSLIEDGQASKYTSFIIRNHATLPLIGTTFKINHLYIDGKEISEGTTGETYRKGDTWHQRGGDFYLNDGCVVKPNSIITLDLTTPGLSHDAIWIGAYETK